MKELPNRDGARIFVDIDGHVVIVRPFVLKLTPMGGRCHACGREMRPWSFREVGPNCVALDCSYCLAVHAHLESATEATASADARTSTATRSLFTLYVTGKRTPAMTDCEKL